MNVPARIGGLVAVLACAATGCGPTTLGDYPRAPVAVTTLPSPDGWARVDEPGWFSASLPGPPKTTFETIDVDGVRAQVKGLSATDRANVWTWIRYFEVSSLTTMLDPETLLRAGKRDFMGIAGVRFLREAPPARESAAAAPSYDFLCSVAPHTPLAPSDAPMVARVRAYGRRGTSSRVTFVIAVWPEGSSDDAARAVFDAFRPTG